MITIYIVKSLLETIKNFILFWYLTTANSLPFDRRTLAAFVFYKKG
jgi:hypothetical protein